MARRKTKAKSTSPAKKKDTQVTFKAFFSQCVNLGKLKPWQEEVLRAHMLKNKLRDKEDLETYQKMLKEF